ncbi:hypothetical protein ACJJTC_002345 [Scirpophaga incertulas]
MQRNKFLKPGRGSKMLEQLNCVNELEVSSENDSNDIIENTPSPRPIDRNVRPINTKSPQLCEQNDNKFQESNIFISQVLSDDDSVADPDWKNPEELTTVFETDSDTETVQQEVVPPKKIKTTQPPKAPKSGECKCKLNCFLNFTEEDRKEICKSYWALSDYCGQKDFILMNVMVHAPQKRLVNATRKRTVSRCYYFNNDDRKIRVCERFFKNTLCISNGPINKAFSEVEISGSFEGQDRRGKHEPVNKTKEEDVKIVKEHIEAFPTMESHYCRKTSSKMYLESNLSISKMYELYQEKCKHASIVPVSINVYRNIVWTQYNLEFHKPKKDQCLMCHK